MERGGEMGREKRGNGCREVERGRERRVERRHERKDVEKSMANARESEYEVKSAAERGRKGKM
jgi:hypothetical protein